MQIEKRFLSDYKEVYENPIVDSNPLIYEIMNIFPEHDNGELFYGLTTIYPGDINGEYYMTKGHRHNNDTASKNRDVK